MTTPNPIPGTEILLDELRAQMADQPWYQRFSNTVTSAAGAVVLILWVAIAAGVGVDQEVLASVAGAIGVLTTAGVLKTKNGITPRGIADVEEAAEYVGQHRKADDE